MRVQSGKFGLGIPIRGWEWRKTRAKNERRIVYRTTKQRASGRIRKKVLGQSKWFRKWKTKIRRMRMISRR